MTGQCTPAPNAHLSHRKNDYGTSKWPVLQLKLEIIHNKKKYYKTIDRKEAQSLYKSPVITEMKIKLFKKNPPMIY